MIAYKAMYSMEPDGVHAEVLDFPGAISCAATLDEARSWLAGALVDMAETYLLQGKALPIPDPSVHDEEADIEEPIYLLLTAASRVKTVPDVSAA
jgi:predicted RNase H-like HicB family nuclease